MCNNKLKVNKKPLLSVITINLDNVYGLKKTVKSVLSQNDRDFEYLIVDGFSSDGSIEIIKGIDISEGVKYLIENDAGIYDAMQKAVETASGKFIVFLNSGDEFAGRDITNFIKKNCINYDLIYGDIKFYDKKNKLKRIWITGEFKKWKLFYGWMPPHPGLVANIGLIKRLGGFNKNYTIAGDYDLILRMLFEPGIKVKRVRKFITNMETNGKSTLSFKNILIANFECLAAWGRKFGYFIPIWIMVTKPALKLLQLR
jgi:glycosyltransferase involved in cell wall biosynthesis